MKKFLFFIIGLGASPYLCAQDSDLRVVATAGSTYQVNDVQLDWTLGEVIIQTLEKPSAIITQGFHQPVYTLVAVRPIPESVGFVLVSPNPFSDELNVKMSFSKSEKGMVELYDVTGEKCWIKSFEGNAIQENYPASSLPSGVYTLVVSLSGYSFVYAYQVVKTQ